MKKFYFLICLFTLSITLVNAQCNEKLLENAKKQITEKEVMANDFKVKLNAATIDQPAPVAEFSQRFEEGKVYRLRIVSDKEEFGATGILRLFEGNIFLGQSYSEKLHKHFDSFDFKCLKTGNYKLLVTFQDGKAGCAVVLVTGLN